MKTLLFSLCGLMIATFSFANNKGKESEFIFFDRTDTLYIQVMDHVGLGHGGWSSVGERDRFFHLSNTLEEVFQEMEFPVPYKIVRFGANRIPPNQPRLDLTIIKWGDNGMSEIEARFMASIKRSYDLNKLGVFTYRGGGVYGFQTGDRMRRVYNDVMRKALVQMTRELYNHLPLGDAVEEEALGEESEAATEAGEE